MRIFVLTTGRSGSMTFAVACGHLGNFTSGHETRWGNVDRFGYPDGHIEVDNRLSWMLGLLGERFPDARYVHLTRDPELVTASLLGRWSYHPPLQGTTTLARIRRRVLLAPHPGAEATAMFAYPMLGRNRAWPADEREAVVRTMVHAMNANIDDFLTYRPHMNIALDRAGEIFPAFCEWIGAIGDIAAGAAEFGTVRNATAKS